MRVLHVGWGFLPWRRGGLIEYADDLMLAQAERGHDVGYFFSGRHYVRPASLRLRRWQRGGVAMHEVVNGPIVSGLELGTAHPELDVEEPRIERAFRSVLHSFRPDVVHVQELLCLPSSLIDVAAGEGVPTVMTLQDYGPLCSTLRLFDADGEICARLRVGEDCAARNAGAPATRLPFIEDTLHYEIQWLRWQVRLDRWPPARERRFESLAARYYERTMRAAEAEAARAADPRPARDLAPAFQRRRDVNVARLARVDRLVAQSPRVAEIYAERGVAADRLSSLPFTLKHIEGLRPRELDAAPDPITFATLGGCASRSKGAHVVAGALRLLRERGLEGRFRLRVWGAVHDDVRAELEAYEGVEIPELYVREWLDSMLDEVDVGIIPSIWEEALAYSGLELIAKGIPLIANPRGGIVTYARPGETAWLNEPCTAEGLADRMERLVREPELVLDMHRRVLAARNAIVRPFAEHADAIEAVYREARE